jgi:RNA polymerase sigma-70 factor (ECF subfamily)
MDEQGDARIILESLEDPARFAEIFERHHDAVYRYAAYRVGAEVGGDVAAEVFLRAFATRHRFRSDASSARPWLFGIATNLVRDHFRKTARGHRAVAAMRPDPSAEVVWFEDVDSRVDAERVHGQLADALKAMRGPDREVLFLYALTGLTYREVAEALEIPIGTVQSRLFRIRAKLRNIQRGIGESEGEGSTRDNEH